MSSYSACGVYPDGQVACWSLREPYGWRIPHAGPYRKVVVGQDFACGLLQQGDIVCWGDEDYGQAHPPRALQ